MPTGGKSAVAVARQLGRRDSRITTHVYEHPMTDGLLADALDVFGVPNVAQQHQRKSETPESA